METMRTIRVTGRGRLQLTPDLTRITLTTEGLSSEYDQAIQKSTQATEALQALFAGFGFQDKDLKTLDFSVDTKYESYRKGEEYRQRFAGYEYRHVMKVEFDSDETRLGKILYALGRCPQHPEFQISFSVKDPDAAKNLLLGKAVADAAAKAQVLTKAAGVSLLSLQTMDYSWGELDLEVRPFDRLEARSCCEAVDDCLDLNIQPEDIEVADTVTLVWEIR